MNENGYSALSAFVPKACEGMPLLCYEIFFYWTSPSFVEKYNVPLATAQLFDKFIESVC